MVQVHDTGKSPASTHTDPSLPQDAGITAELRDKVRETAAQIRDKAYDTGGQVRDTVQELGEHAQEAAAAYYQQSRERALVWEQELRTMIQEKPVQALLIAGGIGVLLGLLTRRSNT